MTRTHVRNWHLGLKSAKRRKPDISQRAIDIADLSLRRLRPTAGTLPSHRHICHTLI